MGNDDYNKTIGFFYDRPVAAARLKLTILDETNNLQEFDLYSYGKRIVTFGREKDNDIVLQSRFVSRHHGRFIVERDKCLIEDIGSTNGLIFEGRQIKSRLLQEGDSIRIDDRSSQTKKGVLFVFTDANKSDSWKTVSLDGAQEVTIGRNASCNICLPHVSVSQKHARLLWANHAWWLCDNGSTNGIIVNGRHVDGKVRLHEKDLILITNSKLIFANGTVSYCCFKSGISVKAANVVKKVGKQQRVICNNVSLTINPCELVAIIGGSGAGKSTFMNCISGYSVPTQGQVSVNGIDLYDNYDALKSIIGYVPQSDIVYDNLTIYDMLRYTARLRLPQDTTDQEFAAVIEKVIGIVELSERKNTLIKNLSGGQRKRVSIAVELISDPNLFFLDEPASGLDPGTERNLMTTLKSMAAGGKTVILVTHSTLNLQICDKIVFMGKGGNLCFYGSYNEALRFFGVSDIVDVYNMITDNSEKWQEKYNRTYLSEESGNVQRGASARKKVAKKKFWQQFLALSKRYLHIIYNDKQKTALLLLLTPVLTLLIALVADGEQYNQFEMTQSLMFCLCCAVYFVGTFNAIQEICKERTIFLREYMTGLRLDAYIASKVFILALICAIQSLLAVSIFVLLIGSPEKGVITWPYLEILLTVFLTTLSAAAIGLFASALVKNPDRAMTLASVLLMPQLLFSGVIFSFEGAVEYVSYFIVCRWSMKCLGVVADLNALELRLQQEGVPIERKFNEFYEVASANLLEPWLLLLLFVIGFSIAAAVVLSINVKKERK